MLSGQLVLVDTAGHGYYARLPRFATHRRQQDDLLHMSVSSSFVDDILIISITNGSQMLYFRYNITTRVSQQMPNCEKFILNRGYFVK